MAAANYDLAIEQGATWRLVFTWHQASVDAATGQTVAGAPLDLTGCTARMQIRRSLKAATLVHISTPLTTTTTTDPTTGETATVTAPNGITIDPVTGQVLLEITAEQTATFDGITKGVYDLEVAFPSGDVYRVLQGAVAISPNVTRPDLDGTGTATAGVVA